MREVAHIMRPLHNIAYRSGRIVIRSCKRRSLRSCIAGCGELRTESNDEVPPMSTAEPTRRDFLIGTASVAGFRAGATFVPLIAQMNPDASAIAAGAIVAGNGLGLINTSLKILGPSGAIGQRVLGQGSSSAFINAVNGNLVLQMQDAQLAGRGLDLYAMRTYK